MLASGAFGPLTAQTAPASTGKDNPVQLERFVSTGTRFSDRTVAESPVPIDIITAAEINAGGYTETAQILQTLVPSFNYPRPSLTDGTDHIRPATLRGLAPDQTLVLINGKRQHSSSLVNLNGSIGRGSVSTDFNVIPSSGIGQIEVLRDGASAQYGSDAIAGVINVILRKDIGSGVDVSWGATQRGDGRDLKVDIYSGMKFGKKGSLFVTAWSRNKSPTNRIQPDTRQQYFGRSATGTATAISGNYGVGLGLSPLAAGTVSLDPREATINRLNHRYGDPRSKEEGLWFNGELPLEGTAITAYVFGGYSMKHGEGAGFFRRPGDDRTIRAIWPDGFLPVIQSEVTDFTLGGGLKGKAGGWNWDLSSAYGFNDLAYTTAQSINDTLGAASKTSFDAGGLKFLQSTTNFDLTNQFDVGLRTPLKVALGAEVRWEQYKVTAGEPDSYRDGGIRVLDGPAAGTIGGSAPGAQVFGGFKPTDAGTHSRTGKSVYVDLENKLTDQWLVSLAGRFEDYSDFGNNTTGKLATRYEIVKGFALRGSLSSGFRAPHLAQQWFSSTATNFISGVPFEIRTFPVSEPVARALGASDLKPEKSVNQTVGLTWQPVDAFTASVDFYRITIDDRIVLSSNFTGVAISTFLAGQGLPAVGGGRYFTNGVDTKTEGVDVTLRYKLNLQQNGKLTFTAGGNSNQTKVTKFKPTPPQLAAIGITTPLFDLTEKTRMEKGQPRNNVNLIVNYDLKDWSFMLRNVRYGEVSSVAFASTTQALIDALTPGYDVAFADTVPASANKQVIQTFQAKWITDLDVTYRINKQVTVSAGVNNLFNLYPTENIRSKVVGGVAFSGSDNVGIFPYSSISPFGFSGASYYGKVSYKF
ncbi:MAG: TonB-dependent receptor [Verrucomicrobia bacterium]|nr:TonB-dependent receptor [Verrucomicrobiota bacterium]